MLSVCNDCRLSDVRRIERVQNLHLWTKYCLRRHEIELAAGAHMLNEQMLFHGCRKDTMAVITQEGFDIRVSLGTGTYFAGVLHSFICPFMRSFLLLFARSLTHSLTHLLTPVVTHSFDHSFVPSKHMQNRPKGLARYL